MSYCEPTTKSSTLSECYECQLSFAGALLSIKVTTSAFLFMLPLVQLLSYLTTKSCDLTLTNQKTAADILAHIQESPLNEHECCETTPNFSEVHSLAELYNILCSDLTKIAPFLKSLQEHYLKGLQSYEHLCVMLCGLAVMVVRSVENATDVRSVSGVECVRLILSTLTSIAQYNQTLVSLTYVLKNTYSTVT